MSAPRAGVLERRGALSEMRRARGALKCIERIDSVNVRSLRIIALKRDVRFSKPVWRAIAVIVAASLFWLATRSDVYDATSPRFLSHDVLGVNTPSVPHPWWLAVHIWLRKFYSIIAFACVGLTAHQALGSSARPRLRAALIVAIYSAGIECAQFAFDGFEPLAERILDVGCGALGGFVGVLSVEWFARRRARTRTRSALEHGR